MSPPSQTAIQSYCPAIASSIACADSAIVFSSSNTCARSSGRISFNNATNCASAFIFSVFFDLPAAVAEIPASSLAHQPDCCGKAPARCQGNFPLRYWTAPKWVYVRCPTNHAAALTLLRCVARRLRRYSCAPFLYATSSGLISRSVRQTTSASPAAASPSVGRGIAGKAPKSFGVGFVRYPFARIARP